MDSLTVTSCLVGLLGSAAKVVALLLAVKRSIGINEAPQLIDQVLSQVKELETFLSATQSFLLGMSSAPRRRISMIRVDQVVATLSEAVLTFSELEALVTSIAQDKGRLPIMSRLTSVWKVEKVVGIMLRLESHKSSLSLMLTIAQSESDLEAEQSQATLQNVVDELLRNNQQMSSRLQNLEESFEIGSIMTSSSRITMDDIAEDDETDNLLQSEINRYSSKRIAQRNLTEDSSQPGFHIDLETSRVYTRTERYESNISFTSSGVRSQAWSRTTGLSLSEVSVISSIVLPLSLDEISNQQWYTSNGPGRTSLEITPQITNGVSLPSSAAHSPPDIVSGTATASRSQATEVQIVMNQHASVFRDPIWASSIGLPGTEDRDRSISRLSDPRTEHSATSASEASRKSASGAALAKNKMLLYKLVVLGDKDVGKTELCIQLALQGLIEPYDPTIEDIYRKQAFIDGLACMLEFLDTSGTEQFTAMQELYIKHCEGFVLVYCITKRSSFTQIREFHDQIMRLKEWAAPYPKHPGSPIPWSSPPLYPVILVGNNSEHVTEREVSAQEGLELARELGCGFVETSAKNCINVEKAFYDVVRILRRQRMPTGMRALKPPVRKNGPRRAVSLSDIVRRRDGGRRT